MATFIKRQDQNNKSKTLIMANVYYIIYFNFHVSLNADGFKMLSFVKPV